MARKPRTKRNKTSAHKKSVSYWIVSFILAVILIFVLFEGTGFLGRFFKRIFYFLFGIVSPAILLYTLILFVYLALNKFNGRSKTNLLYIAAIIFMIMILMDINTLPPSNYGKRMEGAQYLAKNFTGVGVIGSSFGFVFQKIFGKIGNNILFFILVFFANLSFFDYTVKEFVLALKTIGGEHLEKSRAKRRQKQEAKRLAERKENSKIADKMYQEMTASDSSDIRDTNDQSSTPIPTILRHGEYENKVNSSSEDEYQIEFQDFNLPTHIIDSYEAPNLSLLNEIEKQTGDSDEQLEENARKIVETMQSFGIESRISKINNGPTVTCYELQPGPGVKVRSIENLADDIALKLASSGVRIEAPMPGKAAVGIEVPNKEKQMVSIKEMLTTKEYQYSEFALPFALGKNIFGVPVVTGIEKMPHILVAGATGSGKSVCINTLILSLLYTLSPQQCKLLLIDPKMVELSVYNGIPHLIAPVVTSAKKANNALGWAVSEMERRYKLFSEHRVRDYNAYQKKAKATGEEELPYIVIIIDELADLMMEAPADVDRKICRLAQMARACGMHLIVATQRPSVDVITGTIKANIPSRISFQVSSQIDSRTILDRPGAEKLLGKGDMLFFPGYLAKPIRIQGAFVSDEEVEAIVAFLKEANEVQYDKDAQEDINTIQTNIGNSSSEAEHDELIPLAIEIVISEGQASVSQMQRKLRVGYARAGRIIDELEEMGVVGPHEGSKPRKVLVGPEYLMKKNNIKGENNESS